MSLDLGWLALQAGGALAAVLGLAWLLARGARRGGFAPKGQGQRLSVQAVLAIDAKRRAVLLRVDGREVLVIAGPGGETLVGWLPEPLA